MNTDSTFTSAVDIARQVRRGELRPITVVDAYLERIEQRSGATNAYITVLADAARDRAYEIEEALENGDPVGPLAGVPIGIKDLFATKAGVRHTYGLAPFADNVAEEDATIVTRLENAGAIVLGKTNTPDLGWGDGKTENPIVGATATPFDLERTAGGSSGGSAAAVADGLAALAQGSDAGGSIRIPAACCGVVGVFPTFDRVPAATRPDAFGTHTPFIQQGPLARTVEDAAVFLDVVSGYAPGDPFSHPTEASFTSAVDRSIDDLSIAYSPTFGLFPVSDRVRTAVEEAITKLELIADELIRTDPDFEHDRGVYRDAYETQVAVAYASINNTFSEAGIDLRDHRDSITDRLLEFIDQGTETSAVEYRRTNVARTSLYDGVEAIFEQHDLLVTPTLATLPFDKHDSPPTEIDGTGIDPSFDWFLTWPSNLSGHPAASVPAGMTEGLPVGLQIIGPRHADERILSAAAALERARPWSDTYPGRVEQ